MPISLGQAFAKNFLGNAPQWYKSAILLFLVINPIAFHLDPFIAGWLLVVEFIFTLAMALKCYPLQPGGLLAIEAVLIGMTSADQVKHELVANIEVLLLLVFVVISVATGFYAIYHKVSSGKEFGHSHDHTDDKEVAELNRQDLDDFRAFLRSLMMHAAIGTALGGVCTLVGEPQNLIIGEQASWNFAEFAIRMSPVTVPVFICGLLTCVLVEQFRWFGYGARLPDTVRAIMEEYNRYEEAKRSPQDKAKLIVQALIAVWLIVGLAMHLAAVGLIGLSVIVLATSLTGITEEHSLGKAFQEALPFTALLAVFFSVVAVIIDQQLFKPVIQLVLAAKPENQLALFYLANGVLSMVSDNVFVGTVYINEVKTAMLNGAIDRAQFDLLAVAINTGTNLPSVATPNGQAAFLFMLTSALAPLLRLSYGRMVWMALPYTLVLGLIGFFSVELLLGPATEWFYQHGWLVMESALPAVQPALH